MNLDTLISNALDRYRRLLTADELEEMRRELVAFTRSLRRRDGGIGLKSAGPSRTAWHSEQTPRSGCVTSGYVHAKGR